ncbi:MAG TPA: hypothetical protein VFE23_10785 [Usitatibacter sp.]|jgi:hypothetical protein|nr:hypothetical protein [Usitatibacter sp.]
MRITLALVFKHTLLSALLIGLSACATTATSFLAPRGVTPSAGDARIEATLAGYHDQWGPVHYIATMTWIPGGGAPPTGATSRLSQYTEGDWTLELYAARSFVDYARRWLESADGIRLKRDFAGMVRLLDASYPGSGGRTVRIWLLPPATRYDRAWRELALTDRHLEMTFAVPLPDAARPEALSTTTMLATIAHEFSHSYFWFRAGQVRNNYSDEVIAYTTERCVEVALHGGQYDALPPKVDAFESEIRGLTPSQIYQKYKGTYPDTVLAIFGAAHAFAAQQRSHQNIAAYCRNIQTSGRDFTRDEGGQASTVQMPRSREPQ